ncbi:hypothetical protein [Deinococcus sedimenti]|uniref:DUF2357 domain-containing protein n=1 Tax=Deinococcus sedimenti TaxID=1867090 RepID=A0ABQ2S803_9DEIO|nr:hypothetical protein [Deinococcus sedimenti]GGS05730.1 hypothetical protein GCM10008960_35290 [Deinococcus sedimenti]
MSGPALNRLTGAAAALPEFTVAGLWVSATSGLLNGLPVPAGTPLLPDARGVLTWSAAPASPVTVTCPVPPDARAPLGSLDAALTGLALDAGGWTDWLRVSPLDRDLADELHRFPLEDTMERELTHLEAVCRQPRTHLEIFEERQLVSRARQIPVRAVNYLASHTEDWDARTLRGVRPRRVITNVRDDLYDIYENRVAARLIDHLTRYVRRRLARVRELLNGLDTIDLNAQTPPSGMHWRQGRVYELWGESLDLTEAQLLARERLEDLGRLLYRLERLTVSPLYTRVPAKSQVPAQLRLTNILGNDPHYRRVARLWLSWYRHAHTGHVSVQEQQQTAQHDATQFDRYALLLTLHALQQFEFTPVTDTALHPGATLALRGPEGPTELTWQLDGTCTLQQAGTELLRVVASPTPLGDLRREELGRAAAALTDAAEALTTQTVLLYPGTAQQTPMPELHAVSSDPVRLHPKLSCLPISAVDLESVERLARVLRLVLTGARFTAYPPTFETDAAVPPTGLPDVLQPRGPGRWALLGPLSAQPHSWTNESRRRHHALEDARRQLGSHAPERLALRRAQREVERLQAELDEWTTFLTAVAASEQRLTHLRRCPVCGTEGAEFSAWQDDQFHCACGDCGATWSLRRCQACQQRHPWLLPHLHTVPTLEAGPGWADRLYGRDVLTLPDPFDLGSYACPDGQQPDHTPFNVT